jgi:enoyl-CoA hydratase/carnithine racemase
VVGKSHTIELVLMGHMWSTHEAAAWGMASYVVEEGEGEGDATTVIREVVALTEEIAVGKSQIAVQA